MAEIYDRYAAGGDSLDFEYAFDTWLSDSISASDFDAEYERRIGGIPKGYGKVCDAPEESASFPDEGYDSSKKVE